MGRRSAKGRRLLYQNIRKANRLEEVRGYRGAEYCEKLGTGPLPRLVADVLADQLAKPAFG